MEGHPPPEPLSHQTRSHLLASHRDHGWVSIFDGQLTSLRSELSFGARKSCHALELAGWLGMGNHQRTRTCTDTRSSMSSARSTTSLGVAILRPVRLLASPVVGLDGALCPFCSMAGINLTCTSAQYVVGTYSAAPMLIRLDAGPTKTCIP